MELEIKQKIENYYRLVCEHVVAERKGDAAVNIRHIIELIINQYIELYVPSAVFAKTIEKIDILSDAHYIDALSTNTLHQLRKFANKGAHGEGDSITMEEVQKMLPPLRMEIDRFYNTFDAEYNVDERDSTMREYSNEWVEVTFNNASNEDDFHSLIDVLLQYEDNQEAVKFIELCKERLSQLWEEKHADEIRIQKIRMRNQGINRLLYFGNGQFYTMNIYGKKLAFNINVQNLETMLNWHNVIEWESYIGDIYVVFKNGKVGTINNLGKSRYISNYSYGDWDDVVSIAVSYDGVYGVTRDKRIRFEASYNLDAWESYEVSYWHDIIKVRASSGIVVGIRKNGTVVISQKYKYSHMDIQKWNNVEDVSFFCGGIIGLLKNGGVVYSGHDYEVSEKLRQWSDIVQIASGGWHILGLRADGTVVSILSDNVNADKKCVDVDMWRNIVSIYAGDNISLGLRTDGMILSCGRDAKKYNIRICFNVFNFYNERNNYLRQEELKLNKENLEKAKLRIAAEIKSLRPILDSKEKKELIELDCRVDEAMERINVAIKYEEEEFEELKKQ